MKLIESKAEYIPQEEGLGGIYKQIELAGRTAYHSLDKITLDSAKDFVGRMIKSKHGAALEHGTVYIFIPEKEYDKQLSLYSYEVKTCERYGRIHFEEGGVYATTNYRVIVEHNLYPLLDFICSPTEFHEKRYTMRFTCSRAIAQELTRHRVFSFLMESQRYINYSKERHGGEITFIKPSWFKENQLPLDLKVAQSSNTNGAVFYERPYKACCIDTDAEGFDWYKEDFFIHSCQTAEQCYFLTLEEGATPQQARDVLPNATKTELIMTGFSSDWRHVMDLRLFGKTGAPHPDMVDLMQKAQKAIQEAGIWEDIMSKPSKFE